MSTKGLKIRKIYKGQINYLKSHYWLENYVCVPKRTISTLREVKVAAGLESSWTLDALPKPNTNPCTDGVGFTELWALEITYVQITTWPLSDTDTPETPKIPG